MLGRQSIVGDSARELKSGEGKWRLTSSTRARILA